MDYISQIYKNRGGFNMRAGRLAEIQLINAKKNREPDNSDSLFRLGSNFDAN